MLGGKGYLKVLATFLSSCKDDNLLTQYLRKYCKKSIKSIDDLRLGQLSFKEESAGKLRVFALRDIWTQWALKPLHDLLMKACSKIPMDSTLDQDAAVQRIVFMTKYYGLPAYSFDLSAATDRIPVQAYWTLLEVIFDEEVAFN